MDPPPPEDDHHPTAVSGRAEGERLIGIAEKLLHNGDLSGAREFALLAQESDPLLESSDQILAISDVLLASQRRHLNHSHHDHFSILQSSPSSPSNHLRQSYRRLALLLHPDKNPFPLSPSAFKLVSDAWAAVSPSLSSDSDKSKLPVRRTRAAPEMTTAAFWTACPYCFVLYEFAGVYEGCCLRCQNCRRPFHAAAIPSLPPVIPGKEAYYCCWGFFPLGFDFNCNNKKSKRKNNPDLGFPNWMPANVNVNVGNEVDDNNNRSDSTDLLNDNNGQKKRSRPRKNPLPV